MASAISIGTTSLQAAQGRLGASAHNVANLQTPNFRRHVIDQQAEPAGAGVTGTARRSPHAGVALEPEAVEQISATYAFKASLQVLRTSDAMVGALLDVRA